jgi:hypothetical protein
MATMKQKKDMADSLGTGMANKAAKSLMSRQEQLDAQMAEAMGEAPKAKEDEFEAAVGMVRKATKKPGGAMSRSNFN